MSRKAAAPEREREHALIAEVIGYLRGIAAHLSEKDYPDPNTRADHARILAMRLRDYEAKQWPID